MWLLYHLLLPQFHLYCVRPYSSLVFHVGIIPHHTFPHGFGIAGWLRYMMGIDDQGNPYTLAPDPLAGEMTEILKDIEIGKPETLKDQLKPVLSNETIFFTNLYENGVGNKIEELFREMIAGKGAVRAVIDKYM